MSLANFVIESFGGYENAKAVLDNPNASLLHNVEGIKQRLLEYRREHNIFEVRDFVKSKKWIDGSIHKIELVDSEDRTLKIFSHNMGFSYWVDSRNYQHATDAEIKENKRLEGL